MADIFAMVDTWNNGATTFAAIKMNVTDTASAAGSLLMDLQVGGVSKASVRKDGGVQAAYIIGERGVQTDMRIRFTDITSAVFAYNSVDQLQVTSSGIVTLRSSGLLDWSASDSATGAPDLILLRDAPNTLAMRNGTAAQAFRLYNTFTDASNYERAVFDWNQAANILTIGNEQAGTGSPRRLQFKVGTNGNVWFMDGASGSFLANSDNSWDIGASGANRPRDYFGAGKITSAGATAGIGYATGAGGTVTQLTSKSTGVTLNKATGQITMTADALAADTTVSFVLTDSAIAATDLIALNHVSGGTAGAYTLNAQAGAGSVTINVRNVTAGSLSEAIVIGFAVVKAVTA